MQPACTVSKQTASKSCCFWITICLALRAGAASHDLTEAADKTARLIEAIQASVRANNTLPTRRLQQATGQDCNTFFALTITPVIEQCDALTQALQALAPTKDAQCKQIIDFSKDQIDKVCTNTCYGTLTDMLGKMAQSGCSPDILTNNMCSQCPSSTKCVSGICRPACSAKSPCTCSDNCVDGACMPSEVTFHNTDMSLFGYKISLEHLCLRSSTQDDYCFSSMYSAVGDMGPGVCDRVNATGCCAGTVLQYGEQCALSNDTVVTSSGAIKLSGLPAFCPGVDFTTKCADTPAYTNGSCVLGYHDGPYEQLPFPSMSSMGKSSFSLMGVYALVGGIAAMALLVAGISIAQNLQNARRLAEAKRLEAHGPTIVQSPQP